jgi:hypothetical protein
MIRPISPEFIEKRNAVIISLVDGGMHTQKIGTKFGISRERVCQIYYKKTGKSVQEKRGEEKIALLMGRIALRKKCGRCNQPLPNGKSKFCSPECRLKTVAQRRMKETRICHWCKNSFHPYRTVKYINSVHSFCKHDHYLIWRKSQFNPIRKRNEDICQRVIQGEKVSEVSARYNLTISYIRSILYTNKISLLEINRKKMEKQVKENSLTSF